MNPIQPFRPSIQPTFGLGKQPIRRALAGATLPILLLTSGCGDNGNDEKKPGHAIGLNEKADEGDTATFGLPVRLQDTVGIDNPDRYEGKKNHFGPYFHNCRPSGTACGRPHEGIDIVGKTDGIPYPLSAVADGLVTSAYVDEGYSEISIIHPNNLRVVYLHAGQVFVTPGQKVKKGQLIGHMGNVGTGWFHTHLQVDKDPDGNFNDDDRNWVNPLDPKETGKLAEVLQQYPRPEPPSYQPFEDGYSWEKVKG